MSLSSLPVSAGAHGSLSRPLASLQSVADLNSLEVGVGLVKHFVRNRTIRAPLAENLESRKEAKAE
jgi:hypothetical protein